MHQGVKRVEVERSGGMNHGYAVDLLAVEEPLEIRVQWLLDGQPRVDTVAITMRTPGQDEELAAGFLYSEGIVRARPQIVDVWSCSSGAMRVVLDPATTVDLARLERHSYTTSSCGVCGKTSASTLAAAPAWPLLPNEPSVSTAMIRSLPAALRTAQQLFDVTGGLHASALFDVHGQLVTLREDVGRHNALDKVIGAELLAGRLPARDQILIVSGRVSFELVQKAIMAGIPILGAIGAPSSLAVDLARASGMTLVGFLRPEQCNVYADHGRLLEHVPPTHLAQSIAV
jgi:FdhD protein